MSSNVVIVGLAAGPIFGCPDVSWGAGQSLDHTNDGDSIELKNGEGEVVAVAYFNNKKTSSYSCKIKGTLPSFERGKCLTVDNELMILTSWKIGKKSGDFADVTLELTKYTNITSGTVIADATV